MSIRETPKSKLPLARVAGTHVVIILLLWTGAKIQGCRAPAQQHVRVRLSTETPAPPAAKQEAPPAQKAATPPPAANQQTQPAPPQKTPPQKPPPKKTPPKKVTPPKKATKPKIANKPKPAPKWKPRSADSIRAKYANQLNATPKKTSPARPTTSQRTPKPNSQDVARRLAGAVGSTTTSNRNSGGSEAPPRHYYDQILAILHGAWRTPSITEAPDGSATLIQLRINRNGQLVGSGIVRGSGNAAMDASIRQLLSSGLTFPPHPSSVRAPIVELKVTLQLQH